ncbi:MAG: hypothetical protein M1822_003764 [Bathelium mastoideum]|nr:MAG: hypothetical protein M1822_003764 [Bathelium mastoideum]
MALLSTAHDSLPYIDRAPSPSSLSTARALIAADLDPAAHASSPSALHPSLPLAHEPHFPPLTQAALDTLAQHQRDNPNNKDPLTAAALPKGIDLTRYQDPGAALLSSTDSSSSPRTAHLAALRQAHTALAHLHSRRLSLAALARFGANAHLVANAQLEAELRALEAEVASAAAQLAGTEEGRRREQEARAGEVRGLEEGWRVGVGRVLEVEAAAEGVRGEILAGRRGGG